MKNNKIIEQWKTVRKDCIFYLKTKQSLQIDNDISEKKENVTECMSFNYISLRGGGVLRSDDCQGWGPKLKVAYIFLVGH